MKLQYIFLVSILSIILISFAGALEPSVPSYIFKQYTAPDLKASCVNNGTYCSAIALCNMTIVSPNGTIFVNNQKATNQISFYNLTLPQLQELGEYQSIMHCRDGNYNGAVSFNFLVTYNGKENPDGIVVVFFSIGFLIVVGFLSYLFIYNIGHLGQMDYDLGDLIKNVSAYFVLLGLYLLSTFYMGNEMIDTIMVWVVGITGFTNVAMSFLFFIIVFLAKRKDKIENAW